MMKFRATFKTTLVAAATSALFLGIAGQSHAGPFPSFTAAVKEICTTGSPAVGAGNQCKENNVLYSVFHDTGAGDNNPATGNIVATILNSFNGGAPTGQYSSASGLLNFNADLSTLADAQGVTVNSSPLKFDTTTGELISDGTMVFLFNPQAGLLSNKTLGFKAGNVIGGNGGAGNPPGRDPNSLEFLGANPLAPQVGDVIWISLWGADFADAVPDDPNDPTTLGAQWDGDYVDANGNLESTLGIDLRIKLEITNTSVQIPEPMTPALLGLGLVGLAYLRRRKAV